MNKLLTILVAILCQSCVNDSGYTVRTISDDLITIDGVQSEPVWDSASTITSFTNPWNKNVSPKTSFSMLKGNEHLYFYFNARDNEILLESPFLKERDVEKEDRVELFFSKDRKMNEYYCFEMDAKGRTLSYSAQYYRQFNFDWNPPEGFIIATRIDPGGYSVEGAIPLKFIQGLSHNSELYFGVYRAEFNKQESTTIENWLTWIDPKTTSPDFHVPTSLGKLILNQ